MSLLTKHLITILHLCFKLNKCYWMVKLVSCAKYRQRTAIIAEDVTYTFLKTENIYPRTILIILTDITSVVWGWIPLTKSLNGSSLVLHARTKDN